MRQRTRPATAPSKKPTARVWPNGSAVLIPPSHKDWVEPPRMMGRPCEDNPNLIGRIVAKGVGNTREHVVHAWEDGYYRYAGKKPTFTEALGLLKS